jgi:microcystin-dependent protein
LAESFENLNTAARLVGVIKRVARKVVLDTYPIPRQAIVESVNKTTRRATVYYPDEPSNTFTVPCGSVLPVGAGSVVLLAGPTGARYIEQVISGADVALSSALVGVIADFAVVPSGWIECTGQAVSRTTYASLFAVLGTTFGAGNGSTTFNLPDLRGRVSVGQGASAPFTTVGATGGSANAVVVEHGHSGTTSGPTGNLTTHSHGSGTLSASGGAHVHQTRGFASRGTNTGSSTITHNQDNVALTNAFMDPAGGTHTHTIGGSTAAATATSTAHTHTVTVGNTGVAGTNQNLQPYMVLKKAIYAGV